MISALSTPVDDVIAKRNLGRLFLGLQLLVVLAIARFGLFPWNELECGICSLIVHLRQYWLCVVHWRPAMGISFWVASGGYNGLAE